MTAEDHYDRMMELYDFPNPEQQPEIFQYYLKIYKYRLQQEAEKAAKAIAEQEETSEPEPEEEAEEETSEPEPEEEAEEETSA